VASGATGIASSVYSHKAEMALEAGDKSAAEKPNKYSKCICWASLVLGINGTIRCHC